MSGKKIQSLKYVFNRFVLRKPYLVATSQRNKAKFKFKTEDVVGRHIYKRGDYEPHLSNFISENLSFGPGDVVFDIGANIGWYSVLFGNILPTGCKVYAFEPDPLNYKLLVNNVELNAISNVETVNAAVADKNETKKLYRYSSKNLGRHSLLEINEGDFVEVEAIVLDDFVKQRGLDYSSIKFIKIDIEGYEYFALSGAEIILKHVACVVSEFVPRHMIKGGVEPSMFIDLMMCSGLRAHIIKSGAAEAIDREQLLAQDACDIIWLR